jgi:dipeptidyl-peptidase-4
VQELLETVPRRRELRFDLSRYNACRFAKLAKVAEEFLRETSKLRVLALAAAFFALGLVQRSVAAQGPQRLTIERLYSLPHLIGTAPTGFAWNAQNDRVAFLWNDEGRNFRDVWAVDVHSRVPERWTRMPALARDTPQPEMDFDRELDAIEWSVRRERDRGVSAVVWHPNGERLVVSFRGDLYEVTRTGETNPLVSTSQTVTRARFSRNGATLAYLAGGDLWVRSGSFGQESTNLTALADEHRSVQEYRLSPDGRMAAFIEADRSEVPLRAIPDYLTEEPELVRVPRSYPGDPSPKFRLGVVSVAGGPTRWIDLDSAPMDPIFGLEWSGDSTRLVVDTSDLYVKDRRILIVDAASGKTRLLVRERNPLNVQELWQVAWAPDGNGIYFLSDRDEDTHIYYAALDDVGAPVRITRGDWAVFSFSVFESGILFVANAGRPEERHVFRVELEGGEPVRVSVRAGTHAPSFSPDGTLVADYFSSDSTPYELLLTDVAKDARSEDRERPVTHSPIEEFSNYRWVEPEYVTFKSHVDGVTLHGRLTVPPGLDRTRKHPAILGSVYSNTVRNQWGGRTAHPTWGLDQYLVQEGYILLNVNFRGSLGHGKSFRQGIRLDYGGIDVEDLFSGVQYLESLGFVDMDRIGIWGSSYGGLLTCMSLFKKPGVYKAGVAGAPATNVWHALTGEMRVMMAPDDQPQEYAEASAFTYASGLEDHLMIIHGMRDRIVLFKDSVSLVQRLMLLDKDVDFVVLPDSGHGWDNEGLHQTRFAFRKLVQHFERYLGKGPTP